MAGTTTTRQAIRRALYNLIPKLGFNGTADSVAAGSIVDSYAFQDTNLNATAFKGTYIYRPGLSGDDRVKKSGSLTNTNGTLAHTGTNYSDTSDTDYEIVGILHPDELNDCIIRALRNIYFDTQVPLCCAELTDYDMSDSAATSWTSIGTVNTKEKVTTAITGVYSGIRGLHVVVGASSSGVACTSVPVSPNEPVFGQVVLRCDTAGDTLTVTLYDVTNSTAIRSYTTTSETWVRVWFSENVPATCELVSLRVTASGSSTDFYVDHMVILRRHDARIYAPSWLNEQHKFNKLREARYMHNVGDHVDSASSRRFMDWYQPRHYSLDPFHPEANAYAIQLNRDLPTADMWIEAQRPYYDIETLSTESSTTTAPYKQLLAHVKRELAELVVKRYPDDAHFVQLYEEAKLEVEAETLSRPSVPSTPMRRVYSGRI